ncbi:MAG: Peroxyureidoacrylate/ureidoacrylate amidohydrolase RutB [Verrucomicrobia bacterium ADurb.Bin006]|nr:MAG: Peroxyureidoacrylate/ureidoacrylate amidohydrolase RutB [Verrucomicrobia bacterium ADurb.Bin006]
MVGCIDLSFACLMRSVRQRHLEASQRSDTVLLMNKTGSPFRRHLLTSAALAILGIGLMAHSQQSSVVPSLAMTHSATNAGPGPEFLQRCAFVCIDIQPGVRKHLSEAEVPKPWLQAGFTAADVNAANDYAFDIAYPNARLVADACRASGLPMIFVHWGCLFRDGMDLDPEIRKMLRSEYGTNYAAWGHCILDSQCRPADELGVRPGEYALPKTGQNAFNSSNLGFVLTNLNVRNLVFVGGHTEACLGKTAQTAHQRGFRTLCVEDATFNARESTRRNGILQANFDYILSTAQFQKLVQKAKEDATR